MCNNRHPDSISIPESGDGYKIFYKSKNGELLPLCSYTNDSVYIKDREGNIKWNRKYFLRIMGYNLYNLLLDSKYTSATNAVIPDDELGVGFCFFLDKKMAEMALNEWNSNPPYKGVVLYPISYKGGICKHFEKNFVSVKGGELEIALCKEFKIKLIDEP